MVSLWFSYLSMNIEHMRWWHEASIIQACADHSWPRDWEGFSGPKPSIFGVPHHHSKKSSCMISIPVVPARGGAEVALSYIIKPLTSIELACAVRQPSLACALSASALHSCRPGTWPACDHLALQGQEKTLLTLHSSVFTACTLKATLHLISSYTATSFFTRQTFTQRSLSTQKPKAFAYRRFYTEACT